MTQHQIVVAALAVGGFFGYLAGVVTMCLLAMAGRRSSDDDPAER